ncbi:hypothetical protein [Ovoidimarina sediminis]|uniref:hypothetical protein n=1 Tax=Ovoidimarina sediminis TaxID=3079856 RepID=UPI00290D74D9|nr:hypothetical protein [Rhodophyticola sp. MJ-SS7]MDU8943523.1 hypothetical protein [Rhodophyticola sp. MJ-SS7]
MDWTVSTVIPILTLGLAGGVLPVMLARRFPDTLHGLAQALTLSAAGLVLLGAVLFVAIYSDAGIGLSALAARPGDSLRHFLALGLKAALVWAPILVLVGIGLAQGVERRKGERIAARDPDGEDG